MTDIDFHGEVLRSGALIARFNLMEARLAVIINDYVGAEGRGGEFLKSRMLNNSIISYASKVKLILAINAAVRGPKFDRNAFHELGNIRNAFAHGYLVAGIRKEGSDVFGKMDEYVVVESLKPDGSLKEVRSKQAVARFQELFDKIVEFLDELRKLIS